MGWPKLKMILEKGFTLVEGLVSITLFLIVTGSGFVIFSRYSQPYTMEAEALKIQGNLNEAFVKATQAMCFDTSQPHKFGICFDDSSYVLFTTLSDWNGRDQRYSQQYNLPVGFNFVSHYFPNACNGAESHAVIFSAVTGTVSVDGSVQLEDSSGARMEISVSKTGLVEIN